MADIQEFNALEHLKLHPRVSSKYREDLAQFCSILFHKENEVQACLELYLGLYESVSGIKNIFDNEDDPPDTTSNIKLLQEYFPQLPVPVIAVTLRAFKFNTSTAGSILLEHGSRFLEPHSPYAPISPETAKDTEATSREDTENQFRVQEVSSSSSQAATDTNISTLTTITHQGGKIEETNLSTTAGGTGSELAQRSESPVEEFSPQGTDLQVEAAVTSSSNQSNILQQTQQQQQQHHQEQEQQEESRQVLQKRPSVKELEHDLHAIQEQIRHNNENLQQLNAHNEALSKVMLTAEYLRSSRDFRITWFIGTSFVPTQNDWIGVMPADKLDPIHTAVRINTKGQRSSVISSHLPATSGNYQVCYFHASPDLPGSAIAKTQPLFLGPSLSLQHYLEISNKTIRLTYVLTEGNFDPNDVIEFVRANEPKSVPEHTYKPRIDQTEGSWVITIPYIVRHEYVFRYRSPFILQESSKIDLSNLNKIEVETQLPKAGSVDPNVDTINWNIQSVAPSQADWIDLFDINTLTPVQQYKSELDHSSRKLVVTVPRAPREYVYRYWSSKLLTEPIAVSQILVRKAEDVISLTLRGNSLIGYWEIQSVDVSPNAWIGLHESSTNNRLNFVNASSQGSASFPVLPGNYYITFYNGYWPWTSFIRSETVSVSHMKLASPTSSQT